MNKKNIYVPQVDENDCGVAALAMILKYYGSSFSIARLRNMAKTDLEGTTALGIVKAAKSLNLQTIAVRADMSVFDDKETVYPFIVHVIKNENLSHYYVVLGATKSKIIIADPNPTVGIKKVDYKDFHAEWTGVTIFLAPNSQYKPQKVDKKNSLFVFLPILFKQKKIVINIIIASIMITVISILGSYFLQTLIDTYIPNSLMNTLSIVALGLIFLYIFQSIFTYGKDFLLIILSQRLEIDIILGYIKHIFDLPMSFFATRRTGEIVSRFNDANKIIDALASTILSVFLDVGVVVIMSTVLIIQNADLFWISLISIPIYILIILLFTKPFELLNREQMESGSTLNSSIIEDIHGIETIKSLGSENDRYRKIDSEFVDFLKKNLKYSKTDILQQTIKVFIQLIFGVVVLWVGSIYVVQGQLTIGQLMTYNALLVYFINPLQNIINLQTKLQSAKVANNRLNEVYLVNSEFKNNSSTETIKSIVGDISIESVSFSYGYGEPVLRNISLKIKHGEKMTIVGMSGSGKSTLVKLLVDFFTPSKGKILINNHNLVELDKHSIRKNINYIPQDPYVFSGTILENLALGNKKGTSKDDIINACSEAEILDDIMRMPMQFETKLDENGSILSGGQKQRITIARALLSGAEMMIFDESTSGLDSITENKIVNNLLQMDDLTVIFVAHRLSIAKKTNNIVVLNEGRLVEEGTHKYLMNQHGYYFDLINS